MLASPRPSRNVSNQSSNNHPNPTIKSFTPPPGPSSKHASKRKRTEPMKSIVEDEWTKGQSVKQTKKDLDSLELSNNSLINQSVQLNSIVPVTPRSRSSPHSLQFFDPPQASFIINPVISPVINQSFIQPSLTSTAELEGSNKKRRTSPTPPPPTPNQSTPSSPMNHRNGTLHQSANHSQTPSSSYPPVYPNRLFVEPCTPRLSISANASPSLQIRRLQISSASSTPTNRSTNPFSTWNSQLMHQVNQSLIEPDRLTVTNRVHHSDSSTHTTPTQSDDSDDSSSNEHLNRPHGLYMNCANVDAPTDEFGNVMVIRVIDGMEAAKIPRVESDAESFHQSFDQLISVSQRKGSRRQQQDAWCVATNDQTVSPLSNHRSIGQSISPATQVPTFFAVLDGHGKEGRSIANQASQKLPHYFFEHLNQSTNSSSTQSIDQSMQHAFESTHDWLHRSGYEHGGACVIASYITHDPASNNAQLHLGWAGDCSAWLVQRSKSSINHSIRVLDLASSHTLENPAECARIKQWEADQRSMNQRLNKSAAQSINQSSDSSVILPSMDASHDGTKTYFAGCVAPIRSRVMSATGGGELNVTRALGDRDYPSVIARPDTAHLSIGSDPRSNDDWEDGWLILSSDGVSNALSKQSIDYFFESTFDWSSEDVSEALIAIVTKQVTKLTGHAHHQSISQLAQKMYTLNQSTSQSGTKRKQYKGDNCTIVAIKLSDYFNTINQSVNQSVDQIINHSINQSINQSVNQSTHPSIHQTINPSRMGLSVFHHEDEDQGEDIQLIDTSVSHSITTSTHLSFNQSISQTNKLTINQSVRHSMKLSVCLDEDQESTEDDDCLIDPSVDHPMCDQSIKLFCEEEEEESSISIIDESTNQTPSPRRRIIQSSPSTGGSLSIISETNEIDQSHSQSNKQTINLSINQSMRFPRLHLPEPSVLRQTWNPPSAPKKGLMFQFLPSEVQNQDDDDNDEEGTIQLID